MPNPEYDYLFKLTVAGNPGAGKASLIRRFVRDVYFESYQPLPDESLDRIVEIDGYRIKLLIWNGAIVRHERRQNTHLEHVSILSIDGSSLHRNETIEQFIERARTEIDAEFQYVSGNSCIDHDVFIAISKAERINPVDQQAIRQQLLAYAVQKAAELEVKNFDSQIHFVSARENRGVEELFLHVARKVKKRLAPYAVPRVSSVAPLPNRVSPQSRAVNEAQGLITGFFAGVLKFIDRLAGAIISGVFGGLALLLMYNPLAVFYETVETNKGLWKVIAPLTSIPMSLIILLKGLGKSTQAGWEEGFSSCIEIPFGILFQSEYEESERIRYSHVFASWLVMGLTAAVVLAVLFMPQGLTLGLSAATVVGLSGVSTTVLAVMAGITAAIAGSLVYSLEYLWVNKEKTSNKKTRAIFSTNEDDGYGKHSAASHPPSSYAIVSSPPVAAGSNSQRRLSGLDDASELTAQPPASQSFSTYSPVGLLPPVAASASSNPQRRMYSSAALFDSNAPASASPRPGAQ